MDREGTIKEILAYDLKTKHLNLVGALGLSSPMEIRLLGELGGGSLGVGELGKKLNASMPNVSRALRRLEGEGKVVREVDKNDRRNTIVKITEAGIRSIEHNIKTLTEFLSSALQRLSNEDLESYCKLSAVVYKAMADELNDVLT